MKQSYPFVLPPLPYKENALQPYIDEKTMHIHHDILFLGYVTRLNNALKEYPKFHSWSLQQLILENDQLPKDIQTTVYNNAGGVYNHTLFFDSMTPNYQRPSMFMMRMLQRAFGSIDKFKEAMLKAGMSVFGSGWTFLVVDDKGRLKIITTKNQDTPLPQGMYPLLPLDVWEHAYLLQYVSARNDYINNWFHVINWAYVEKRLCAYKHEFIAMGDC